MPTIPSFGLGFLLCRVLTLFCLAQNTLKREQELYKNYMNCGKRSNQGGTGHSLGLDWVPAVAVRY